MAESWSPATLRPFLGQDCQVTLACRACGRQHRRSGRLVAASTPGEVLLAGMAYSVEDILAIQTSTKSSGMSLGIYRALGILGVVAGYLSWLRLVHR